MIIKCDLELRTVCFELKDKDEAVRLMSKLSAALMIKCMPESTEKFAHWFDITRTDTQMMISLIRNHYYAWNMPKIVRLALGQDLDIALKSMHLSELPSLLINDLAQLIFDTASPDVQFQITTGNWGDRQPGFEQCMLKQLTARPELYECIRQYVVMLPHTDHDALLAKMACTQHGPKANTSATTIQCAWRSHSARKQFGELKKEKLESEIRQIVSGDLSGDQIANARRLLDVLETHTLTIKSPLISSRSAAP